MAKILIVDDDALMIRMYQTKFKSDGYSVETAADGEECLSKIGSSKPDLVLLDIMMPKVNGLQVLKKLKSNDETNKIPVVLLSNVGEDNDINKGLEMGAVAYLVKASYTPK
ncbi:MAG: Two-component transcriptional regulator, partial [Candidatus Woesebacteria bacterium GW2011_GWA1_39_12]